MHKIIKYECEFCGVESFMEENMKSHEEICESNPNGKKCGSCFFLKRTGFEGRPEGICKKHVIHTCENDSCADWEEKEQNDDNN